ncbi:hypothetical protein L249_1126 [Ophiocordyceps polyrhachis-furcata BCC 54312]|uniref:DNA-directed RNA polymerase subunit n=1 Tax=Ophiocordyceps polyrhachis-furcata BCC 54312 TaxID=1330021 RepID=A0A367LD87_9HYPO|nr:hypothetical protein L249_1126 [Ophiocordyceps polyrhachis-furcata BCC 54312]
MTSAKAPEPATPKSGKRNSQTTSDKKRAREDDSAADEERKLKKPKSAAADQLGPAQPAPESQHYERQVKKEKRKSDRKEKKKRESEHVSDDVAVNTVTAVKPELASQLQKDEKQKRKLERKERKGRKAEKAAAQLHMSASDAIHEEQVPDEKQVKLEMMEENNVTGGSQSAIMTEVTNKEDLTSDAVEMPMKSIDGKKMDGKKKRSKEEKRREKEEKRQRKRERKEELKRLRDEDAQQVAAATTNRKESDHDEVVDSVIVESGDQGEAALPSVTAPAADGMDVDKDDAYLSGDVYQPPDTPAEPQFPFFSQTVSLYKPLWPTGWAQPVAEAQHQHLEDLVGKYVPQVRGVLLKYDKVTLGSAPGRRGAAADDEEPTTVVSHNEYAVGFGWITADVELFVPSRGSWMEGIINLQTEGHIGVVCFEKFNASVEAVRLPPSWKWVSLGSVEAEGFDKTASFMTDDNDDAVQKVDSTGFWVDGRGAKVQGKIRFRIRNFDAGTSGGTSYLSLEGTMLDPTQEKELVATEARTADMRRKNKNGQKSERRTAPEFSLTRFGADPASQAQKQALQPVDHWSGL